MAVVKGAWSQLLAPGLVKAMSQQQQNLVAIGQNQLASMAQAMGMSGQQLNGLLGQQPNQFGIGKLPQQQPNPVKTILVAGPYKLTFRESWYVLSREDKHIVAWLLLPNRSMIAAAIRNYRNSLPCPNSKDAFGSLLGIRFFTLSDDFILCSPQQRTRWETSVLTVEHWDESEVVRGVSGIHAAWPPRKLTRSPFVDSVDRPELTLTAAVRANGRFVAGKEGWRAEKVIIDTVYLPPELLGRSRILKRLQNLYPEVSFEEEPWTLERSSKSEKSSLKQLLNKGLRKFL
jgi:hypothetical protein